MIPTLPNNGTAADMAASFERDGFVCPIAVMSPVEAESCRKQLEDAESKFGRTQEFSRCLKRYPNLVMPFIDELTRRPEITDVIAEILGPDLLVLDVPFFIKEPQSTSFISWHQDVHYWGLETDE